MATLDYMQIIKRCFDATTNSLRIQGVAGALDDTLTWQTGLGPITHILGPTDQELAISSNNGKSISLGVDELNVLTISALPAGFSNTCGYPVDLDAIAGGADVDVDFVLAGGVINIVFSATDPLITNFAAVTAAEVANVINDQTVDLVASVAAGQTAVDSAYAAQDWTLQVTGGTAAATLSWPNGIYYGITVGTLMGQLKFGAGLGPMVSHVAGPDDQNFYLSSAAGQDLWLRADGGNEYVVLNSTDVAIDVYNPIHLQDAMGAVAQIVGPSDQPLTIFGNEDYSTFGTYWGYYGLLGDSLVDIYGQQGYHSTGGGPFNLAVVADPTTLTVSIDGGGAETITFASTDAIIVANGGYAALTVAGVAAVINDQATDFYAIVDGGFCRVVHKQGARDSTIEITGGTARATLGLPLATERGLSGLRIHGSLEFSAGMGALATGHIVGPSDQALYIVAEANYGLNLVTSGTGHATLQAAGGSLVVTDTANTINVTGDLYFSDRASSINGTVNRNVTLAVTGTAHAILSSANNTLTVYDDAATGIEVSGHLHVSGLMVMDAAQIVKVLNNELGTAHTYAITASDYVVGMDVSANAKAVTLPAAATAGTGRILIIKDQKGSAAARNITINAAGGEKIDGAASYTINANFQSVTLVCCGVAGAEWLVL